MNSYVFGEKVADFVVLPLSYIVVLCVYTFPTLLLSQYIGSTAILLPAALFFGSVFLVKRANAEEAVVTGSNIFFQVFQLNAVFASLPTLLVLALATVLLGIITSCVAVSITINLLFLSILHHPILLISILNTILILCIIYFGRKKIKNLLVNTIANMIELKHTRDFYSSTLGLLFLSYTLGNFLVNFFLSGFSIEYLFEKNELYPISLTFPWFVAL
jgi:hypothetical protein